MPFTKRALAFFRDLSRHNEKSWFEAHREEYEAEVRQPMRELIEDLDARLARFAPEIGGEAKRSMFRINRDIRFSKDKSPYKTHVGLSFPLDGSKKEEWCGFYIGFEPAKKGKGVSVFAGGGIHMPMPPHLKRIRAKIASEHK